MTPTARLTHALRSLADALEGPLPCSDPEMPARRLLERIDGDTTDFNVMDVGASGAVTVPDEDVWSGHMDVIDLLQQIVHGTDALDALCDAGLCDE